MTTKNSGNKLTFFNDCWSATYDDTNKENKKYSKNLTEALKENMNLKRDAEKDAQTLEDTLSMNQVLIEELKVKDAIIKVDNILQKEPNKEKVTDH